MSSSAPTPDAVRAELDGLGPPGTPVTTPEVAENFDCTNRTIYNRLESLVEDGIIETKKVGARGRVWWQPVSDDDPVEHDSEATVTESTFRQLFENVSGLYLILEPEDYEIVAVSDAYLDATMTERAEIMGENIFDVFPADPDDPDPEGAPRLRRSLERVKAEQETDVMPVTFYPIPRPDSENEEFEDRWWSPTNAPVVGESGDIDYIIHRVEDVTPVVRQLQADGGEAVLDRLDTRDSHLTTDIMLRGQELHEAKETTYDRLQANEERLNAFVTATSEVVYRMSPDWTEMHELDGQGFIADTDEVRSNWLDDYIPPDEQGRVQDTIAEAIETKSTFELEHQVLQVDGTRGWTYSRAVPILNDDGEITEWFGTASDITERKQREQLLEAQKELLELIAAGTPLDKCLYALCAAVPKLSQGVRASILLADDDRDSFQRPIAPDLDQSWGEGLEDAPINDLMIGTCGEAVFRGDGITCEDVTTDDRWSEEWRELCVANDVLAGHSEPIRDGDGEPVGSFMLCFDEPRTPNEWERQLSDFATYIAGIAVERHQSRQALQQTNESLERLNDASRELIDADTEEISEHAPALAQDVLDADYVALWRYDDRTGDVYEFSRHTSPELDPQAVELPDEFSDQVWQTFISDDINVVNDLDSIECASSKSSLRSRILAPLGRHGVICVGSTHSEAFDELTVDLMETVAATVETAWDRADGEQELERKNAELTRLDNLNTLIRQIDQALVQAETVDEIDEAVCDRLAESALFEFAWVGDFDAAADAIEPRAWAGVDSSSLADLIVEDDKSGPDGNPFMSAIQTGETQIIDDIATDARAAPWREIALELGARSCLSIPLVYDEFVYGVLKVYDGTPQYDDRDTDVLAELGQTIAHAIHTVETRGTDWTDSVIELTLRSETAETPLCRLARETGCAIEFEGLVPGSDDEITVFFTATDIVSSELVAAGEESLAIDELHQLTDHDEGAMFKARLADSMLATHVLDRNATVRSLSIDAGTATTVIDLSESADVRRFVERIQDTVPDLELLGRRTRTHSLEMQHTLQGVFEDRLTPRQQEILQLAYRSGFFESPRVQTGKELSDALDLSQSTFNYHLRGAERSIFEVVFDSV
ncbi:bacterio-opsin activator domain-containing protein [Natrinema gelatinilyticum]|uniref:bacterio-opsin activator domain-containing protein n=1 Tax=Natrinema gelatinilyticum TaxID=2961571 RepID=UPI0020C31672|nr:bacterio-opsin activator domain-containing protein [Natrinema gelatinilyticum]